MKQNNGNLAADAILDESEEGQMIKPFLCQICGNYFRTQASAETHVKFSDNKHDVQDPSDAITYIGESGNTGTSYNELDDIEITILEKADALDESEFTEFVKSVHESINIQISITELAEKAYSILKLNVQEKEDLSQKEKRVLELYDQGNRDVQSISDEAGVDRMHAKILIQENRDQKTVFDEWDLSETQERIIDYIAKNPDSTNAEVSSEVDCSISYPSQVKTRHFDKITARAKEVGTDTSEFEQSENRRRNLQANNLEELTDKQEEVLRRLSEEDNPKNPESSFGEIVDDLSFKTSKSYVADVIAKYSHFAVQMIESEESKKNEDNKETTNNSISSESKENDSEPDIKRIQSFVQEQKKEAKKNIKQADDESKKKAAQGRFIIAEQIEEEFF